MRFQSRQRWQFPPWGGPQHGFCLLVQRLQRLKSPWHRALLATTSLRQQNQSTLSKIHPGKLLLIKAAYRRCQPILIALTEALAACLPPYSMSRCCFSPRPTGGATVAAPTALHAICYKNLAIAAHLFRIPERWRRCLLMRLACSLASVSHHNVQY